MECLWCSNLLLKLMSDRVLVSMWQVPNEPQTNHTSRHGLDNEEMLQHHSLDPSRDLQSFKHFLHEAKVML